MGGEEKVPEVGNNWDNKDIDQDNALDSGEGLAEGLVSGQPG